ncbi:MAG: threonylcarbamoyl-AMP synthase [Lachnospiraceae bacterium]|nr:threonylcarbamoyl-AMP synthase [Lachnospiraceae bacterium]
MKTVISRVNSPDDAAVSEAADIIRKGGLVAFPTETVYGLGANGLDPTAASRIYAAKGRPSDNPLILHISCMEELYPLVKRVPEKAKLLADRFWPGPLTMIFEKSDIVPYNVTGGLNTVAVRMPSDPVAAKLIELSGVPIAAPSANLSGKPSTTSASHVIADMNGRIDMILDGGDVDIGIESTIVDTTEEIPMILRPGHISIEQIREAAGDASIDPAVAVFEPGKASSGPKDDRDLVPRAPGMKYRHYAPKGELVLVTGEPENVRAYIDDACSCAKREGRKAAVIASEETKDLYSCGNVFSLGSIKDEKSLEHGLFRMLRKMDDIGAGIIFAECFDNGVSTQGLMNRMLKASGNRVINADEIMQAYL